VTLETYANWALFAADPDNLNAKTATDHHSEPTYYADRTNWITLIARRSGGGGETFFTLTDIKWGAKK
jgi:hypothetical protein